MSNKGWISLHRKITDHWIWKTDKPFDKRAAWVDILLLVNHKPGKAYFNNEIVEIDTGEHITSEVKLAERWGWSRTKVRTFLNLLEQDNMIKNMKENGKRTRLKVLNYSKYQNSKNNKKTRGKQEENNRKTGAKQERNTNNNDNNENNENNDNKKNNNNVQPEFEIKNIYNSLNNYWKTLFKDYIDIYRFSNKTNKITTNRHLKLLKEIKDIFDNMKFKFDGQEYNLSEDIFEEGINTIIEREIDSLNYAKKIWISNIEEEQNEFSKASRKEERKTKERKKSKYDQDVIFG